MNGVHLPFGAEYALKITEDATSSSTTTELFAKDVSDAWIPAPSGAIDSDEEMFWKSQFHKTHG